MCSSKISLARVTRAGWATQVPSCPSFTSRSLSAFTCTHNQQAIGFLSNSRVLGFLSTFFLPPLLHARGCIRSRLQRQQLVCLHLYPQQQGLGLLSTFIAACVRMHQVQTANAAACLPSPVPTTAAYRVSVNVALLHSHLHSQSAESSVLLLLHGVRALQTCFRSVLLHV